MGGKEFLENNDVIRVAPIGWEWYCPKCTTTNTMSRYEYTPSQPVTCEDCGTEFDYSEEDID